MVLYRIIKRQYADLSGVGGIFYPGHWHHKGVEVIYTAESRALAVLEYMVHVNRIEALPDMVIMKIEIPDHIGITTIPKRELKAGWNDPVHKNFTRDYGTTFLKEKKTLILKIPSVVIKEELNYIINPNHSYIKYCKIKDISAFSFDDRLNQESK